MRGTFLYVGEEKLWVRGVTYGAFRPDPRERIPNADRIEQDFARWRRQAEAVRIPTRCPPGGSSTPRSATGSWSWWVCRPSSMSLISTTRAGRRTSRRGPGQRPGLAGHRAVLCYAVGNEIPAPMLRWLGRGRIERYLEKLVPGRQGEDPDGLVTYVNYPTTEYLELPFLDFACFNVYLESQDRLEAYLARLHNLAGDQPLLMGESASTAGVTAREHRHGSSTGRSGRRSWRVRRGVHLLLDGRVVPGRG